MLGGGVPKITGAKAHAARMKRLTSPEAITSIGRALYVGGERLEVEAVRLITEGAVSGKGHVVSAPGQPPNADTHGLDRNIETIQVEPLKVEVSSNARYAAELEFGTSKMAERPYMRPATARKRSEITDLVRKAVAHVAKGGSLG